MIKNLFFLLILFFAGNIFAQVSQIDTTAAITVPVDSLDNNNFNVPVFTTTGGDADSDMSQQDMSSLLQSSRDIFAQFSLFHFNQVRYRLRGYTNENQLFMVNGVNFANLETGIPAFNLYIGLLSSIQYNEFKIGNTASRYGFSGAGGYSNLDVKASSFRKRTRINYSTTNRTWSNRISVTHSTGMMENGWALTLSASAANGNQVYIPGTYLRSSSFYMSVDKKINDKHLLSLTALYAPTEIGGSANGEQLEAYQRAGTNYYNSSWGYQDGKVRNSRVGKTTRPMATLTYVWTPNSTSKLTTSLFFNWGKSSFSGINWNNSPNPVPNYYKYLPSYYYNQGQTGLGDELASNWENNVNTRQVNWDNFIAINRANLYTIPGQPLNTTETRSRYILEDRIEDMKNFGFNTVYNKRIENLFISAGVNANIYQNHKYKVVEDLLGGTYWLDYDQFAQNLGVSATYQQNNLAAPDKKIYVGDKFGYDYNINVNKAQAWGQAEYSIGRFDMYGGLEYSTTQVWREGFVANGKFPTDSKGKSDILSFMNYGVKGGLTYKINGRNFLTANGSFLTRPPEVNAMFISQTTRNDEVQNVKSEKVMSYEFSYLAKYPGFKARATYYNTAINDQTTLNVYFHDVYQTNVNYILTGVNETHKGIELALEKTLFTSHVLQAIFGYGNYYYTNNPMSQSWQNNNNTQLYSNRTVYIKNYQLGGTPQMVGGFTYRYIGKKRWTASATFNYFGNIYTSINPDRRTSEAVAAYYQGTPNINAVVDQEKLPNFYTINLSASKSFNIKGKYLSFSGVINNLLNNKTSIISGYEQLRWDVGQLNKFQNKYTYMMGLTYRVTASFSF